MDNEIRAVIEAIHSLPHGVVVICTGGGSAAVEWLLAVPGASATVLEALVRGLAAGSADGLLPEEGVTVEHQDRSSPVARLLRGSHEWLVVRPDGQMQPEAAVDGVLFPGAFNPLHAGHRRLAALVSTLL